jgi:hypothetical protein
MTDDVLFCGFSYDHEAVAVDEADGITSYVCTNCEAEWTESDEEDEQ